MSTVRYPPQAILVDGVAATGTLTREVERVDVSMSVESRPDPSWEYTDAAGHFHAWSSDGELPTLRSDVVHEPCSQNGCCDGYDTTTLRCAICDEEVFPGHIVNTNPPHRSIFGRESWTADVDLYIEVGKTVSIVAGRIFGIGESVAGQIYGGATRLVCGPMAARLAIQDGPA